MLNGWRIPIMHFKGCALIGLIKVYTYTVVSMTQFKINLELTVFK